MTSRLTGAEYMTPCLRLKVQVCESVVSQLSAMHGSATISPLSFMTYLARPSKTWWATWMPSDSCALTGSMETGLACSG